MNVSLVADVRRTRLQGRAGATSSITYIRTRRIWQRLCLASRVLDYEKQGDEIGIAFRWRRTGAVGKLTVGALVNCTGPNYDIASLTVPLVAQLRDEGFLQQDPLRLGPEVDDRYQVIDRRGRSVANLFYVGPMLKARYWEGIAVRELRVQSLRLARLLLAAPASDKPMSEPALSGSAAWDTG